ncbi:uncharacterized protein METZ01_LOCUS380801, partial [marine metagenome]
VSVAVLNGDTGGVVRHSTQDTVEITATARSFGRGRTEVEQDTALPGVGQAEFRAT